MLVVALLLAALIGISLGLLGGGGSILTLPILSYVMHIPPKPAITMSLIVVGVTSAVATIQHARNGNVRWGTGLFFGASSMLGAFLGGRLSSYIPGAVLLGGFGVMMLVTSLAMLRGRKEPAPDAKPRSLWLIPLQGFMVGAVTGLIGAGGGFLVVPALALFARVPMKQAVGTSLFVIAMNTFAGAAGHFGHVTIDWTLTAGFSVAAVLGTFIGTRLARGLNQETLRRAFAFFVLLMGFFVIGAEVIKSQLVGALPVAAIGVLAFAAMAYYARRLATRAAQSREEVTPA
ncbi:MAG: sulfite exporter TauE/SafE family protein [Polyangiaceae bacterium]